MEQCHCDHLSLQNSEPHSRGPTSRYLSGSNWTAKDDQRKLDKAWLVVWNDETILIYLSIQSVNELARLESSIIYFDLILIGAVVIDVGINSVPG